MAEQKNTKKNKTADITANAPSAAAAMQDLYKKLQTEGGNASVAPSGTRAAPKYDEDRAVSTRKQLMEDYRKALEELGKDEKHKSSRPNLYEYEDLTADMEEETSRDTETCTEAEEESVEAEAALDETGEETVEIAEIPVEVTEEPAEAEEAPIEAEEESVEAEEALDETEEETVEIAEIPVEVTEEPAEAEEAPIEAEEESVEAEEALDETIEEPIEVAEVPAMVAEEPAEAAEEMSETAFRPVSPFRRADTRKNTVQKIPPSKQKDPYSVYDYDMAQDFGYIPVSREKTVSKTNEKDEPFERHITVFMKSESSPSGDENGKKKEKRERVLQKRSDGHEEHDKRTRSRERSADKSARKRPIPEPQRVSVTEDARIRENPKKEKDTALWRMVFTGGIAVILLFWEYLPRVPGGGYLLFGVIGNTQYPFLYIGIAAILLILGAASLGRQFFGGFRELLTLRCTPRSLTAFAVTLALLSDLFSAYILTLDPAVEYGIFHYPAAVFVFLYAIGNYCTVCRKSDAYAVFGSPRVKHLLTEDGLCEHIRNHSRSDQTATGGVMRRFTVKSEVLGVEKRLDAEARYDGVPGFRRLFFLLVLLGMGAMLVSAFLTAGYGSMLSRMAEAVRVFLWTVYLSIPLAVTEIRRIPLMKLSEKMRKKNTALAGDAAAAEYATVSRVAVRSEFFLRRHACCFGECLGNDPERLKFYLSSIFVALGEPFSKAVLGDREEAPKEPYTEDVKLVYVAERTVRAYVAGVLCELFLNDNERAGYRLSDAGAPKRESAYRLPLGIAVEGESVGTCSVYLQNDADYPVLTRALYDHGLEIEVCHYTFLSFLNEKTLHVPHPSKRGKGPSVQNLSEDTAADRLLRRDIREDAADSGITALNAPKDLWLPLVYAEKIVRYNRFAAAIAWCSVLLGAALSVLTVSGVLPIALYPAFAVLLPPLFGVFTYLFSNYFLS